MAPFHLLGQGDKNKMHHEIFSDVMHLVPALVPFDADGLISGTTGFV